ncbi:MAG: hypothetical protein QOH71_3605 [Blastocatellia bacterium]|jgi:hypothetical protein|nr:hypothetical protein [Blastocatellia bacterium]
MTLSDWEEPGEEERRAIWNKGPDSIEAKAETDEIELPTRHPSRFHNDRTRQTENFVVNLL